MADDHTNVYCDLCHQEVGYGDSFVVADAPEVMAFHYECGRQIHEAMQHSLAKDSRPVETNVQTDWKHRELQERLDAAEDQIRKVSSVWRLWLNDAARGAINPGTFDTMRTLLGMEKA